jgi:hypothetical protein
MSSIEASRLAEASDPARPSRVKDEFLADDHLHGNDAGYRAMADSIDLSVFR